jgi:hypothetical protein
VVVRHLAKVEARVRFSYPAPFFEFCSARRIASLASGFSFGKISLLVILPFFHNFADGRCVFSEVPVLPRGTFPVLLAWQRSLRSRLNPHDDENGGWQIRGQSLHDLR